MFSTILVPLDGSDLAAAALAAAKEMARRFDGRLLLVQAIDLGGATLALGANAATGGVTDPAAITGEVESHVAVAKAYLSATAEQIAAEGIRADYEVRDGDAGEAILEAAGAAPAELIVISSHGRGGLSRLVFGSVTTHVIRNAPMPVMVIRGRTGQT